MFVITSPKHIETHTVSLMPAETQYSKTNGQVLTGGNINLPPSQKEKDLLTFHKSCGWAEISAIFFSPYPSLVFLCVCYVSLIKSFLLIGGTDCFVARRGAFIVWEDWYIWKSGGGASPLFGLIHPC